MGSKRGIEGEEKGEKGKGNTSTKKQDPV